MELQSIGYRFGSRCQEVEIEPDQQVSYMEVTYDKEYVNSFFAKTGENSNVLFGARKPGD